MKYEVKLAYAIYHTQTIEVEASSIEEACDKAYELEDDDNWDDDDDPSTTFVFYIEEDGKYVPVPDTYRLVD